MPATDTITATHPIVVETRHIVTRLGKQTIHQGVSLSVRQGEIAALIGGSGTGKSVLLKVLCGLLRPADGSARLFDTDIWVTDSETRQMVRQRFGMLFQDGALFSSLTVEQNIAAPLREHTRLSTAACLRLARLKLSMVGLEASAARKMPDELSGGMRKRAALARALALDPELLFLDEPTSGLDPVSARSFDQLLRTLRDNLGLTVLLITHDLDSLLALADQVIVLAQGKVLGSGTLPEIQQLQDPWLKAYFSSHPASHTPPTSTPEDTHGQ